jgi:hypothetical protein
MIVLDPIQYSGKYRCLWDFTGALPVSKKMSFWPKNVENYKSVAVENY